MEIRVREERLPGVGVRYELDLDDGSTLFVLAEAGGRRHIGRLHGDDEPAWQVVLDQERAVTLAAALLLGARFAVDSTETTGTTPTTGSGTPDDVVVDTVELTAASPAIGLTASEIHLPDDDAVVLAVFSDSTPELVEDERTHRCRPGDHAVFASRSADATALARFLRGAPAHQGAERSRPSAP